MKTTKLFTTALAAGLTQLAPSQDQATTIWTLAQRADVIVQVEVTASVAPSPAWVQRSFQSMQTLKGTVAATFTLTEPAGRCCGRSLFSLQTGDACLLFLRRLGPTLHTLGGSRGVLPARAELSAHVRELLQAPSTNALGRLLARRLDNADKRIAHDAAMTLATLPNLSLTSSERGAVTAALATSVNRGTTKSAALVDIAVRLGDAAAVDAMLPIYINARRNDQAALLRRALKRCPPGLVAERMPLYAGATPRNHTRAATLLTELPPEHGHAAMTDLLSRPVRPEVKMQLCEGLLAAGVSRASLSPMVPKVVLDMAVARQRKRPTLRNIDPRR
ncbi:MAG: hypothetical protein CMJ88_06255 [Planctomycetes bacterium]|nr:hypothetical protein [Planctomycetota bacterium]